MYANSSEEAQMHLRRFDGTKEILELITLTEAAKRFPSRRRGRPAHVSSLIRYVTRGLKGHRLRAVKAGATWCTTLEWLEEFFAELASGAIESSAQMAADERHDAIVDAGLVTHGLVDHSTSLRPGSSNAPERASDP
jgi:hypothetical protein